MRTAFVDTLTQLMHEHSEIICITADMGYSVFENLQEQYPKRLFNSGVTEQSSVGLATGLALSGYKVFFYAQAPFATMRCFEQVRLDVGYNNVDVKIIGTAAGFSLNQLGLSHFAIEDVGLMRLIPNMTVFTPGDPLEIDWATKKAYEINGPVYIRVTKSGSPIIHKNRINLKIGEMIRMSKGNDLSLLVSGSLLPQAVDLTKKFAKNGLSISLFSVPTVKPLNVKAVLAQIKNTPAVITLEEHSIIGGLGSAVAEIIAEAGIKQKLLRMGIMDEFTEITGSHEYLLDYNGLSVGKLYQRIRRFLR